MDYTSMIRRPVDIGVTFIRENISHSEFREMIEICKNRIARRGDNHRTLRAAEVDVALILSRQSRSFMPLTSELVQQIIHLDITADFSDNFMAVWSALGSSHNITYNDIDVARSIAASYESSLNESL